MKLKFFLALILVVLLGGCSLLSQDDEEAPFLADASRCDVKLAKQGAAKPLREAAKD